MQSIKFKRIPTKNGRMPSLPQYATPGSAAADLRAHLDEPVMIQPGQRVSIQTGLAMELDLGYVALIFARSGLAIKNGISLSNAVGVIDSDYRGEICVGLMNQSDVARNIEPGERIAQIMVMPVQQFIPLEASDLGETERSTGGFGSTGKY